MSDQRTLASVPYDNKGRVTRRERFVREMDAIRARTRSRTSRRSCASGISGSGTS